MLWTWSDSRSFCVSLFQNVHLILFEFLNFGLCFIICRTSQWFHRVTVLSYHLWNLLFLRLSRLTCRVLPPYGTALRHWDFNNLIWSPCMRWAVPLLANSLSWSFLEFRLAFFLSLRLFFNHWSRWLNPLLRNRPWPHLELCQIFLLNKFSFLTAFCWACSLNIIH